uniref:Uncharacterized protein n=1 Tax=Oscillatoriales cyanobacterium SpSt-418 TaxID=2282169 RepID=A0A7C3KI74_9CYAN
MAFLHSDAIDQHFAERRRLGRLISALLQAPAIPGFGIDEDPAIIVDGDALTVVGHEAAAIVDESELTYDNFNKLSEDESIAVCDIKLHILSQGF